MVKTCLLCRGVLMLNVCRSEEEVVTDLLQFHSHGHGHGQHRPRASKAELEALWNNHNEEERQPLTLREIEVATLLAKGLINKEVADRLNISMTTVITHRKNIMTKLGGSRLVRHHHLCGDEWVSRFGGIAHSRAML